MPRKKKPPVADAGELVELWREFCAAIVENGYAIAPTVTEFVRYTAGRKGAGESAVAAAVEALLPDARAAIEPIRADVVSQGTMLGKYQSTMSVLAIKNWCGWADKLQKMVTAGNGSRITPYQVGQLVQSIQSPETQKATALDHAVRESAAQYGVSQDVTDAVASIAAGTGRPIVFGTFAEGVGDNAEGGSYDPQTGVITINATTTAEGAVNFLAKHELTHSVEGTQQWEQLADIAEAQMGDEAWSAALTEVMETYAAQGKDLDLPAAEREVVATWIGNNLYKSGFAQAIVDGNVGVGNAFVRTLDRLRLALGNKKSRANTNLAVVERLFMRALEQEQVTREGDVEYFASGSEKGIGIKEQLREHLDEVNEMEPVANISYHHIDRLTARQAVSEEFKRLGYKVDRQGFGIIEIGEKEIGVSVDYVHTPAECAAWLAVPKVLKRGKLIYSRDNHKSRGHDTITIAAPVVINGTPGVMGVLVKQTGKNHYKSHRILMPDGSAFEYRDAKDAEPTSAGMTAQVSGEGPAISSASDTTVAQNAPGVNTQFMQNGKNNTQSAIVNRAWMQGDNSVDRMGNAVDAGEQAYRDYLALERYMPPRKQETLSSGTDNVTIPTRARDGLTDDEYFRMLQKFVDEGAIGEADGFDEYHENFTQQPNKSDFELAQTTKITKKKYQSNYGKVDRELVNSKKYHDKFNELTKHSSVNEALYQEATHILEHRDGSPYEDMIILDARTGKYITGNTEVQDIGKTGLTIAQYELFKQHTGDMIIIHNHPNNSRISYKDILTMYQNPKIFAVVALGHDGTVQIVSNLNRNFPVDEYWQKAYNYAMEIYENEMLAVHKATTALYELGIFNTESR